MLGNIFGFEDEVDLSSLCRRALHALGHGAPMYVGNHFDNRCSLCTRNVEHKLQGIKNLDHCYPESGARGMSCTSSINIPVLHSINIRSQSAAFCLIDRLKVGVGHFTQVELTMDLAITF